MKWWIWVILGMWVMVLVGLGCSPTSDPNGNGGGPISRDTPSHLLNWLAVSYQDKDLESYEEALHDEYLFVFTKDVADSLGLDPEEPWWGKTKDVASTGRMFGSSEVTDINMKYISEDPWVPHEEERPDTTYSGVFSRVTPDILVTIEKPGKEPLRLVVNESFLDVVVVKDPKYPDQNLWVFLKIEEIEQNPE
jgi:hypothetical protein